jgi:hypothetical protein
MNPVVDSHQSKGTACITGTVNEAEPTAVASEPVVEVQQREGEVRVDVVEISQVDDDAFEADCCGQSEKTSRRIR